jgi:hypothetical protein
LLRLTVTARSCNLEERRGRRAAEGDEDERRRSPRVTRSASKRQDRPGPYSRDEPRRMSGGGYKGEEDAALVDFIKARNLKNGLGGQGPHLSQTGAAGVVAKLPCCMHKHIYDLRRHVSSSSLWRAAPSRCSIVIMLIPHTSWGARNMHVRLVSHD